MFFLNYTCILDCFVMFVKLSKITQDHKNYSNLDNKKEDLNSVLFFIWAAVDSNHRPHPYQGCALTT